VVCDFHFLLRGMSDEIEDRVDLIKNGVDKLGDEWCKGGRKGVAGVRGSKEFGSSFAKIPSLAAAKNCRAAGTKPGLGGNILLQNVQVP
jgi:hypothetical protein